ncbi:MAG: EFR1 family ferrodoxin [Candidatus Helarchaeota archaeon]
MPLKSIIFYFSQSGNTKQYAEKIAEGLSLDANICELVRFRKLKEDLEQVKKIKFFTYDLIGIGVPVYYFKPPFHILDILKAFPDLKGKKGFLFCTNGGNPGATLYKMKLVLDTKGLKIIDGTDQFLGLDRHQMYRDFDYVLPSSIGHPNDDDLKEAYDFGIQLIEKVSNPDTPEKTDFRTKDSVFAQLTNFKDINKHFPKFNLNEEKCSQCGLCAETCPVDAIILDPFPKWIKDCDRCYICEMWCPEKAIECDWTPQVQVMNSLMRKKGYIPKKVKK